MADNSKKSNRLTKLMIGSVAAVLVAALAFGVVFAYLSGKTGSVKNTLTSDEDPIPTIYETFEPSDGLKQNVSMGVGVDYECYVRAAIVINWVTEDEDGNTLVYSELPVAGTDYTLTLNVITSDDDVAADKWFLGTDGYYYYTSPVITDSTEVLITSCQQLVNAPDGYYFNVQIVAQTIQASGWTDDNETLAVVEEWGVTVDSDGLITGPMAE